MSQSNDWNKYFELLKFLDEFLFGLGLHLTLTLISFSNLTHDAFCWRYFSKKVLDREDTRGSKKPYTRNWLSSWKEILASYRKEILLSSWKEILYSSGVEILSVTLKVLILATLKKILPLRRNEILCNFVMKSS